MTHYAVYARIENRDHLLRVFPFDQADADDRACALQKARTFAASQAPYNVCIEDAVGALIPLIDTRTCENCAQSVSRDPKCGLCVGPTATLTRWQPVQVLPQNNDAK